MQDRIVFVVVVITVLALFVWANVVTFIAPPTEAQIWSLCYQDSPWSMHQCILRQSDKAILVFFIALMVDFALIAWFIAKGLAPTVWLLRRWGQIALAYTRVRLRPRT
jgi:hypothetical protein